MNRTWPRFGVSDPEGCRRHRGSSPSRCVCAVTMHLVTSKSHPSRPSQRTMMAVQTSPSSLVIGAYPLRPRPDKMRGNGVVKQHPTRHLAAASKTPAPNLTRTDKSSVDHKESLPGARQSLDFSGMKLRYALARRSGTLARYDTGWRKQTVGAAERWFLTFMKLEIQFFFLSFFSPLLGVFCISIF